ncbi:Aluminum-activated malate transporter 4 [Sesamum angolense]|uniref:Aluminum-activated malate transporter 4 n=1 Tax=Sesamum angolense TaxID=2727404 RepID=A0AAE1XEN6_9LAMI|nr:Aluminum-activated malate transporter 4 [Sesamum angolense]
MSKERLLPFGSLERNEDDTITCSCFKLMHDRVLQLWKDSCNFSKKAFEMGRKDPRKVIYAIKMGFALALVSLFIFWKKPADVSQFSIWAILTVIVMFEFSIGATFIKGFNRGLGTFCAGMLAFLFAELSLLAGEWEKVVIVISFFITGSFASYLKLYPTMAPYEYGYRVFVLTFCILMVAGNRTREYTVAILSRLVLIAVGACICFIINICIYPIWAGDDLHHLVVNNFKELAASLEGCVDGYLKYVDYNRILARFMSQSSGDQLYLGYKTVIESASREQTLLGFAVWEPPHGRYRTLRHPWRTYVKVSGAVRHCAYTVMALHGCILSEIQAPPEKRQVFRSQLQRVSSEGAKVLRELGNKIEKMEKLGTDDNILKEVLEDLGDLPSEREYETLQLGFKSLSETAIYVKSPLISTLRLPNKDLPKQKLRKHVPWPSWISFEGHGLIKEDEVKTYQSASALSLATFASLLIEFVARLQNVVDCFEELSEEAEFKDPNIIVLTTSACFWTRFLRCFSFKS